MKCRYRRQKGGKGQVAVDRRYKNWSRWPVTGGLVTAGVNVGIHHMGAGGWKTAEVEGGLAHRNRVDQCPCQLP